MSNNKFNFLNDPKKIELLQKTNKILNITQSNLKKIIFIYSKPKVGSTSLVTSLRIFVSHAFNVIHIHDEEMLRVLGSITNITVNELILYNHFIGKEVYVIDVYRSPIERKISTFFEKIDCYHFNNVCNEVNKYDIHKFFNRFDKIFPYIGTGDHFIDTYGITIPLQFNFENKYLYIKEDGIHYIKLRLKDSDYWENILTKILKEQVKIVKDYETVKKPIKDSYLSFKEHYRIPINFLEDLDKCPYLNYYYSESEKLEYLNEWKEKSKEFVCSFTVNEYKIYEYISIDNNHLDVIQQRHYLDDGCRCKGCRIKRFNTRQKILNGETQIDSIIHEDVKSDILVNRINIINKMRSVKNKNNKKNITTLTNVINLR